MYWIGRFLCGLLYMVFGRWQCLGSENVPKTGGVILAPNHVSYSDPPAVGCGVRRQVHYMAKKELFHIPVLGLLIKSVGAFPVKRGTADRAALRRAIDIVQNGGVICMFPEGTRSPDGELMKAESGIGMVALKSRATVVPVALIGTDRLLPLHSWYFHFSRVRVVYGKPMTFDDLYERGVDREAIDEVGRRVMAAIGELKKSSGVG
jgi:1-acyl-sn-glycerol-3-phosphate acyltransferase